MPGSIDIAIENGVATVRICNPQRRNAIDAQMWRKLRQFAEACDGQVGLRAVIFTGEGTVFSAGADISGFDELRNASVTAGTFDDLVEEACRAVEAISQPTIAAIEGHCIGAGLSLATSCDLRIASHASKFAVPAARLGLGYDDRGIVRFRSVFGSAIRELLFLADVMPAQRAHQLGALATICEPGSTMTVAKTMAETLARNAPLTLKAAKTAMRAIEKNDADLLERARQEARRADNSEDYAEGRAAFASKRPPIFKGV